MLLHILIFTMSLLAHAEEDVSVTQRVADPTARLPSVTLRETYVSELWEIQGTRQTASVNLANPYYLWKREQLLNVSIPYNTGTGLYPGLGATQIFNLTEVRNDFGRLGVGIDAILNPPAAGRDGILYGPALGFVREVEKCRFGGLSLNYFGEAVSMSALQVIAGCSVGHGLVVSTGNMVLRYDLRTGRLLETPVSVQVAKTFKVADQAFTLFLNPTYNFENQTGSARWSTIFGVTFLADPYSGAL